MDAGGAATRGRSATCTVEKPAVPGCSKKLMLKQNKVSDQHSFRV